MSDKMKVYQLNVVPGDYGLISFDPECAQSILYTKIAKVPCEVKFSDSYKVCTFYSTPSLVINNTTLRGYKDITKYLKSLQYNLDGGLNVKQCSETMAITSMIIHKLRPLFEFIMWSDKRNNDELVNPWHMKVLRLPFNYYYTKRKRKYANDLIESMYSFEDDQEVIKNYLFKAAIECLTSISNRLGKDDYFHNKNPTSLDILAYSYIAPFFKVPFKSLDLNSNMIKSMWPNLETFIKRIDAKFVSDMLIDVRYLGRDDVNQTSDDEVSYSAIIILSLSAVSLVFTFALNKGFIKL